MNNQEELKQSYSLIS